MGGRVLITGVAGFVGSNLAASLLGRGYTIVGLDNLSQGFPRNMEAFRDHKAFSFHQGDVRDTAKVQELMEQVDAVAHLAAYKIPRYGDAIDTLRVNAYGTKSVLEAARNRKTKIVITSTSDCYGRNPDVPFSEDKDLWMGTSSIKRWAYAVSKMYDEHLCFSYLEEYKVPAVIVRLFGGYGPHQNLTWWGGPQSVFIAAALNDQVMEVHGDGQQTRSFTFVGDHVDGLTRCLERDQAVGEVLNLGYTEEITILDLAKKIWGLAGKGEPKIKMIPYRTFGKYEDVRRRIPNLDKSRRILGFDPTTTLDVGLPRAIEWQRGVMQKEGLLKGGAAQ